MPAGDALEPLELDIVELAPPPATDPSAEGESPRGPSPAPASTAEPASPLLTSGGRFVSLVLALGILVEGAGLLACLVDLGFAVLAGKLTHSYSISTGRMTGWVFQVATLVGWAYLVLRSREQRGGRPALEELQRLLLVPVHPARSLAVLRNVLRAPPLFGLLCALQLTAALFALFWVFVLVRWAPAASYLGLAGEALLSVTIAATQFLTRRLVLSAQAAEEWDVLQGMPLADAASGPPAAARTSPPQDYRPVTANPTRPESATEPSPASAAGGARAALPSRGEPPAPNPEPALAAARLGSGPEGLEEASAPPARPPRSPVLAAPSERCLSCGASVEVQATHCPQCRALQLVDVLALRVPGPRELHAAAIGLSRIGPPVPDFAQAKALLSKPAAVVLSGVSRVLANEAARVLRESGCACQVVPAKQAGSTRATPRVGLAGLGRRRLALAAGVATLVALAALGGWAWTMRPQSVEAIARRCKSSVVTVRCKDRLGTGFFVAKDRVLTNDHVACSGDERPEIVFADGRRLPSKLLTFDDYLDLAVLEVPDANAEPLRLGDASDLSEGSRVVMIGSPKGLDFTVNAGLVSHVGRSNLGIAYLQFDGNVNHGNSGGPLLDERGRVVGVVTLRLEEAQGVGFAVPVNYLADAKVDLGPSADLPRESKHWLALKDGALAASEKEVEAATKRLARPVVADLWMTPSGETVVHVAMRSAKAPEVVGLSALVRDEVGRECRVGFPITVWEKLEVRTKRMSQWERWLVRNGLTVDLYSGVGYADNRCVRALGSSGELRILDGDTVLARSTF